MKREKTTSDYIREFILFLDSVSKEYESNSQTVEDCEKANNDLLHQIELGEYKDRNKATTLLHNSLVMRREAKDNLAVLKPVADWIATNQTAVKILKQVLGEVRKKENLPTRHYYPRIIKNLPISKN